MLQIINELPAHVFGIHARGKVTRDDVDEVILPGLEEKVNLYGKINYILVLDTPADGFTLGALLYDIKLGIKYYGKWQKIAIVSDASQIKWATNLIRLLIPGRSQFFKLDNIGEAIKWVSGK